MSLTPFNPDTNTNHTNHTNNNNNHTNNNNNHLIWKPQNMFLNTRDPELPYRRRNDEEKTSIHWGQRKLGMVLMQFLTRYWDPTKVPNPVIVYAGAAPGINIKIIAEFFPEAEFHLYDPAPFKIKPSEKIHLYQQYFMDEDAEKWANRDDIYFVSDIRTADYTKAKNLDDNEKTIMKDMEMQMDWYNIIKPVKGHLKFRLPYTGGTRPERMEYLYGHVIKQPWAPQTTTETRLVPFDHQVVSWSCRLYQSQLFHHNVIVREQYKYSDPNNSNSNSNSNANDNTDELTNDWDSMAEMQIWKEYLTKRGVMADAETVNAMSMMFTDKLTHKSKYKDTLSNLRSNPQAIKNRNFRPSRDNIIDISDIKSSRENKSIRDEAFDILKPPVIHNTSVISIVDHKEKVNHDKPDNSLADNIGL